MTKRFAGTNGKLCVAVKFDEVSQRVVKIAEQFCLKTGSELRLVHICEDFFSGPFGLIATGSAITIPVSLREVAQASAFEVAESKIRALSKTVDPGIRVSTAVLTGVPGTPAELIEAEALASFSSLIVVGTTSLGSRFVPKGFSCALSLMSRANVPVMVVNGSRGQDLSSDAVNLVIADDLRGHNAPAVVGGCELAFALKNAEVQHIHVNGVSLEVLSAALDTALASSHSVANESITAPEIFEIATTKIKGKLQERVEGVTKSFGPSNCTYRNIVVSDASVHEALEKYVKDVKPNLVVFGRHLPFHKNPFNLGHMPFYAMLSYSCPVVVFPSAEES